MRIEIPTHLPCPPETVWQHVQTPRLLEHICWPLIRFTPVPPARFGERWEPGRMLVSIRLFGVVPLGTQWIGIELPDGDAPQAFPWRIRDNGSGTLAKRWDHWIEIRPADDGGTHYVDRIDIEAGWLTPFVAGFAALFYRHRQARWRRLVRAGFRALEATPA